MSEDREGKGLADILKKVVTTGIGAAFMTEEAVKDLLQGLPLPKEMVQGLLANAKSSKDEFIKSVKSELKSYLNRIDISKEVDRILDEYDMEINAKINFKKRSTQKAKAKAKSSSSSKKDK